MNFLTLILKTIYKCFIMFWYILMEAVIFSLIYKEMVAQDMPILANILGVIFVIWLITDLILRIFIGTGKSIINYIINI